YGSKRHQGQKQEKYSYKIIYSSQNSIKEILFSICFRLLFYVVKVVIHNIYSLTVFRFNSLICETANEEGASNITSLPILFFGKAIKSRILSLPPKIAQSRSNPKAIPPCGGAPYSKAPSRNPNFSFASSSDMPNASNIFICKSLWKIRIDPPPIS